jgi:putative addiction module component (TIGR02574 family)
MMRIETQEILDRALKLSALYKARLVDALLSSLDKPDEAIDALWRQEGEDRITAYHTGHLRAVSLAQVVVKYRQ